MIIRIYTIQGCIDIESKTKEIDIDTLNNAIANNETIVLETKQDTIIYINAINVVAIELIKE